MSATLTRFTFQRKSGNAKTGPLSTVYSSPDSCPPSCPFRGMCYASDNYCGLAWRRTTSGMSLGDLVNRLAALPAGSKIRYGIAGDLPQENGKLHPGACKRLDASLVGKKAYAYTHTELSERNLAILRSFQHLTVNLSANGLRHADELIKCGLPVVAVVPREMASGPRQFSTPAGHHVVLCPATVSGTTCDKCMLCARRDRTVIVAFPAHGNHARQISELVR